MNVTWLLPAKIARAAFVWHQHSRYWQSLFANFFALRADKFIAVSKYCASNIPHSLRGSTAIVANPFDPTIKDTPIQNARVALRSQLGVSSDTVVLGFFGNLEPQKRPQTFVALVRCLNQKSAGKRVVGCLFGEPREPMLSAVRNQITDNDLEQDARIMGFLYPPEVYLAACDVLVACAVGESFGRTLVEAMLVGIPVVAARSGGHQEIIRDGDNGVLVTPDDIAEFAVAVSTLIEAPWRTEELDRIRTDAIERYAVEKHVNVIVGIYDALTSP